jgi:transcription antitermination factor NusG
MTNILQFDRRSGDQGAMTPLIDIEADQRNSPYRWYLVQSKPGQHKKAKYEIRRAGLRAIIIMKREEKLHHRHGGLLVKRFPAFDSYLFLRMPRATGDSWARLRSCNAVAGVMTTMDVHGIERPFAIAWRVVAKLLDKQRRGGFDFTQEGKRRRGEVVKTKREQLRDIFKPGARLKVKEGAFAGFTAIAEGVDTHGAVDALIQIFGRDTPFNFTNPAELEVIEAAPESEMARGPRAA